MKKILSSVICSIFVSTFLSVNADTYSLTKEAFASALPATTEVSDKSPDISEYVKEFDCDGAKWTLQIEAQNEFSPMGLLANKSGIKPFVYIKPLAYNGDVRRYTFVTDYFAGKAISSINFVAAMYKSGMTEDDKEKFAIRVGDHFEYEKETPFYTSYMHDEIVEQSVTVSPATAGSFSISFTAPTAGDFAFSYLNIEYEENVVEPVTVSRVETVAVGHPVMLEASSDEATVFYTVDGSENWVQYNRERGVVFAEPGDFTLKYYAENGDVKSEVITEEVRVVKVAGIAAALQANNEIEVVGKVVGQTDRYALIADDADAALSDCLAVESSDYAALKSARIGDVVKATGRATDKFGSEVRALGSISSLSVNNQASVPTNIAEVRAAMFRRDAAYDIQGRPATSRTRLIVTPSGAKELR